MNFFPRLPPQSRGELTKIEIQGVNGFERRFSLKLVEPDVPMDVGVEEMDSDSYYPSLSTLVMRSFYKGADCDSLRSSATTPDSEFGSRKITYQERCQILPPSSPDIISQFNNFSFNAGRPAPPRPIDEVVPPTSRPDGRLYSEVDMEIDANIFKHRHLIIRNDFITGRRHLRPGEHGYLTLSSLSSIKARNFINASNDTIRPIYQNFSAFSIDEAWDSPLLKQRRFFNRNATLIFVERPGKYTKGGDPLFEFIGNFYIRRLDRILVDWGILDCQLPVADAVPLLWETRDNMVSTPPYSESLALLQSVNEADLV